MTRRRKRRAQQPAAAGAPARSKAAGATDSTGSSAAPKDSRPIEAPAVPALLWLLVACFFLSGFAALIYQIVWLRQFSIVFGTSELAVATVLAAYMGGLAAGAAAIARWQHRITRPVLAYGLLEAGIAASALAVPALIAIASYAYAALLGGQAEPAAASGIGQSLFYVAVAFLVLLVPTGLMGATLPLLIRHAVRSDLQLGPRIALLYATNTAGAVVGTLVAAFVLVPTLGLQATVWCAVFVNGLIFAIVRSYVRRTPQAPQRADSHALAVTPEQPIDNAVVMRCPGIAAVRERIVNQPVWILPLMLASGAVAFTYEVLWTRLLTHVVGGSLYSFAMMLAAFLAGIAIGGAAAGRLALRRENAAVWFACVQAGIAVLAALVYQWMESLIPSERSFAELAVYSVAVMLPATVFIGATFPLAVRLLAATPAHASDATARVYAWNTVGAIAGALLTGFVLLPALGFEGLITAAVIANLIIALATLLLTAPIRRNATATVAAMTLGFVVLHDPGRPDAVVTHTAFNMPASGSIDALFYKVGRSATVIAEESNGRLNLRTNGLPEASIGVNGSLPIGHVDRWLTALPIAARPGASRMLVVGFGGGSAIEAIPASISAIDVIELEPTVIEANAAIAPLRRVDPLADPRVRIIVNDARSALRLTDKAYDIIVSQPSHPWTAGASHLYTREFAELARQHLNDDGVFLQWIGAGFVDIPLLRSVVAGLNQTFTNVRLYQAGGSVLLLLASDGSLDIESQVASSGEPLRSNLLDYSYIGLNGAADFAAALVMDENNTRSFSRAAHPVTDDRNAMATDSRALADGLSVPALVDELAAHDTLLDPTADIRSTSGEPLDLGYIATRWLQDGFEIRAQRLSAAATDAGERAFIEGLVLGARGQFAAAGDRFETALQQSSQSQRFRFALIEPHLQALATNRAETAIREIAGGLSGSAAAVVRGWQLAAARNWNDLARLDDMLAAANPDDLWYPEATRLRAEWRVQRSDGSLAFDAMRMIDRALTIRPTLELLLLRAAAVSSLNDGPAFVETARNIAAFVRARIVSGASQTLPAPDVLQARLVALRSRLDSFAADTRRARQVADEVSRIIDTLGR